MLFLAIDPSFHLMRYVECEKFDDAVREAGLPDLIDHATFGDHLGIVVADFGMFDDPDKQDYFSVEGNLYAGNALVYAVNDAGETVDIPNLDLTPTFLHGREEVESMIKQGLVDRPEMTVNGELVWAWPDKSPFDEPKTKERP